MPGPRHFAPVEKVTRPVFGGHRHTPTPRALEVLRKAAEVGCYRQVAGELYLSVRTVHHHLLECYRHAGVSGQGRTATPQAACRALGLEVLVMDGEERAAMREAVKQLVELVELEADQARADRRRIADRIDRVSDQLGRASRILGPDAVRDLQRRLIEAQGRLYER